MRKIKKYIFTISILFMIYCGIEFDLIDAKEVINSFDVLSTHKVQTQEQDVKFEKCIVSKHVDGDTVYVKRANQKQEKIRFIGVNTPETKHPTKGVEYFGKEASDFTKSALLGKAVYLEKDTSERDRYGRLLRYIWLQIPQNKDENEVKTKLFNAILVKEGYAQVSTFPPDVKYAKYFIKFQREAKDMKKGLWN